MSPSAGMMKLVGDRALIAKLRRLGGPAQRRVMRPALSTALTPIVKAAKRNVPTDSGTLKKSIGRKVKTYKNGSIWGGVGPMKGKMTIINGKKRNPTTYAHLVEFGHVIARGGKIWEKRNKVRGTGIAAGNVPAHPFLRPALDANRQASINQFREKVRANLLKEAQRK